MAEHSCVRVATVRQRYRSGHSLTERPERRRHGVRALKSLAVPHKGGALEALRAQTDRPPLLVRCVSGAHRPRKRLGDTVTDQWPQATALSEANRCVFGSRLRKPQA